jgi:hypothetical protein
LWNTADGSLVRMFDGSGSEASDAVFAGGRVTVVDSGGRITVHQCDACLPDEALIARARERLVTPTRTAPGGGSN